MEVAPQLYHLYHLLHLLCLSFAVGLAYLALERFRYSKEIRKILNIGIDKVEKALKARSQDRDTAITRLQYFRIKPYKYGGSFFFGEKKSKEIDKLLGTDQKFVIFSLFVLFILICSCTIKTDCSSLCSFYFTFIFSILAILFILYLICIGKGSIKNVQKECDAELIAVENTYQKPDSGVSSSVDTLADLIKLFGKFNQQKKES